MKKILILITFVLFAFGLNAQSVDTTYNKWSISADFSNHMVSDKFVNSENNVLPSFGGDIRYSINPKIGIGLSGGYDIMELEEHSDYMMDGELNKYNSNYARLNFEAYVDVFNMVDINSNRFTTLFHGGPGVSYINSEDQKIVPNLRGGFTLLFRITERVSLKGDISVTGNFGNPISLVGYSFDDISKEIENSTGIPYPIDANTGVHSTITNSSLGLSISLGKNKKHMDNYTPEVIVPAPITNNTYITNKIDTTINNYFNSKMMIMIDTVQYVFFDNDKYVIKNTELGAIFKTYINIIDNPGYTLIIKGLASASEDLTLNSDSNEYNMKLSENRANVVKQKFLDMGISPDRISIQYYGKDKKFPKESVHDVGRRVELIVVTQ